MSNTGSVLTTQTMQSALARRGVSDLFVEVFDSLPSTSEYLSVIAQQLSQDSSAGTLSAGTLNEAALHDKQAQLCVADWQTNGNGRRGKSWVTDRGNVTFSMLLSTQKPASELLGLSLVTGICVAESLAELAQLSVQLKWPNDVLVNDKKLCGLLTELTSKGHEMTLICVGVGINYKQPSAIEGSDYEAVSLPMLSPSAPERVDIISDVCARLLEAYRIFEQHGWSAFADRWAKFDYLKGKQVRVINAGEEKQARAVGVNNNGALLIEQNKQISVVYSGDVSVRLA